MPRYADSGEARARRPSGASSPARRGGFTLIELLTVMVVIAILAAIALPRLRSATERADAAIIVEDVRTILLAGVQVLLDTGQYPPDESAGVLPGGLAPYLGSGFDFDYQDVVPYTWRSDRSGGVSTAFVYVVQRPRGDRPCHEGSRG